MGYEIQSMLDVPGGSPKDSQTIWESISADIFKIPALANSQVDGAKDAVGLKTEEREGRIPPKEIGERPDKNPADIKLTREERELGDRIVEALGKKDTRSIDAIIRQYAEWPKSLAKIVDYANAHYDQNDVGISIAYSYYERNTIFKPGKEIPRRGNAAETGYLSYNYAAWNDTPGPDGRRSAERTYLEGKWGGGRIRTSAYTDKADDVNEPIKLNREDSGEKLYIMP